jgi:hypothetical protein
VELNPSSLTVAGMTNLFSPHIAVPAVAAGLAFLVGGILFAALSP